MNTVHSKHLQYLRELEMCIETGKVETIGAEMSFESTTEGRGPMSAMGASNRSFLSRQRGIITTPMNKSPEEFTAAERAKFLQNFWKEADKKMIRAFTDNTAGGHEESQSAWAKRMGLKAPRNRDQRSQVDWSYWVEREEAPTASEIAWIFGHLYDPTLGMHDERIPEGVIREEDVNVLDMSWPEQRTFRWNNPEGYKAWVDALKAEMGPHFDERLVLPEYKLVGIPKPRELAEDALDSEPIDGAFIPSAAKSTTTVEEVCADCGALEDRSIRFGSFDRPLCLACRLKEMKRVDEEADKEMEEGLY